MDVQNKSFMNRIFDFMARCYSRIPEKLTNTLYIVALTLFLLYDYNFLTRFPREPFQKLYMAGAGLGGIVLIIRFLNIKNEDKTYVIVSALLVFAGLGYYLVRHSIYFLALAVFMVGARHVSDRTLIALYLIIATAFFSVMFGQYIHANGFPASGALSDFGGINTTDTQGMIFFIMVAYLFLRGQNIKLVELAVFAGIVIWFWTHTCAENNMYCAIAGLILAFMMLIGTWIKAHPNKGFDKLMYLASASFVVCGIIMIALVVKFDVDDPKWVQLDRLLHVRLSTAHPVFVAHPPCPWGSEFLVVGKGYDPSQNALENMNIYGYSYIDSSYPQILIMHGYIIYTMIIGAMTALSVRYARRRNLYCVLLLALIAVDCMAEGHLKEISCNIWLLCLFADIINGNGKGMDADIQSAGTKTEQG